VWLHLDADDREPATFFHYLRLAAEAVGAKLAGLDLLPEYRESLSTFARRFFRALFSTLPARTLIVLDNYEALDDSAELNACVAIGMHETTQGSQWAVLSRHAPPNVFVRLQVEGTLATLEWEEIRFSREEAELLISKHLPEVDPIDWLNAIYPHNHGWVAGLILAMGVREPDARVLGVQLPGRVFDYFAAEVFDRLDTVEQDVLMCTACLPEFSENDVAALTLHPQAVDVLDAHVKRGHFVFRLDTSTLLNRTQPRYRYHPLFRSFLLAKARSNMRSTRWEALHASAAERLVAKGQPEQAIPILVEVGRWSDVCKLVRARASKLLETGRHDLVSKWLEKRPEELEPSVQGWLTFWHACARLPFDPPQANELYSAAFQCFERADDTEGLYLSWSGGVESLLYGWGTFKDFDAWFETQERVLSRRKPPNLAIEARFVGTMYGALVFRRPDHPDIDEWERRVRRFMWMSRVLDPHHYVLLSLNVFYHDLWRGNTVRASALLDTLSGTVRSKRVGTVAVLAWHTMRAIFLHVTGDGNAAIAASREGLALAEEHGVHFWDFMLIAQAAYGALVEGQTKLCQDYLRQLAERLRPERELENMQYFDALAQLDLQQDRITDAVAHAKLAVKHVVALGSPFPEACHRIGASQVYFAAKQDQRAYAELERAEAILKSSPSTVLEARAHLARAQYALERSNGPNSEAAAQLHLERGFALCREAQLMGLTWWRRPVMARLCAAALSWDIESEFVRRLIRERGLTLPAEHSRPVSWPCEVEITTLGGSFQVLLAKEPVHFSGKAQRRPMELLQALIALGGRDVCSETLADALWPESDGDAGQGAVATTLHRLRRLIGARSITRTLRTLSLDLQLCRVDCFECEQLLNGPWSGAGRSGPLGADAVEQLLTLYTGPFLPRTQARWAVAYRERLASRFVARIVLEMGAARTPHELARATHWGERALEAEPRSEALYGALIANLKARGLGALAADMYRCCCESLRAHYGCGPSSETRRALGGMREVSAL
jgi:DNA-binding SARP family transcriptional activator